MVTTVTSTVIANNVILVRHLNGEVLANLEAGYSLLANSNVAVDTGNVFFIGTNKYTNENNLCVFVDGVKQPPSEWVLNSGNSTIQFKDAIIPIGTIVDILA